MDIKEKFSAIMSVMAPDTVLTEQLSSRLHERIVDWVKDSYDGALSGAHIITSVPKMHSLDACVDIPLEVMRDALQRLKTQSFDSTMALADIEYLILDLFADRVALDLAELVLHGNKESSDGYLAIMDGVANLDGYVLGISNEFVLEHAFTKQGMDDYIEITLRIKVGVAHNSLIAAA